MKRQPQVVEPPSDAIGKVGREGGQDAVAMRESGAPFLRALVTGDQPPVDKPTPQLAPAIVVDMPGGARVSISASASADLIAATLRGLR